MTVRSVPLSLCVVPVNGCHSPGASVAAELRRVDAVLEAWAEDQHPLRRLAGHSLDPQAEDGIRIRRHEPGRVLEEVVLAIAVGIDARRRERVLLAEMSHLPGIIDAVVGISLVIIRRHIHTVTFHSPERPCALPRRTAAEFW
jgi:hypothetical protein